MSTAPRSGLVAVLFTDLVGSTELMSQLGERPFDELRRQHFAALGKAVAAHGGEEVKNTGDGILAVFGSAAEAVEAAVAMQQATVRQKSPLPLAMRVGVAVGDATLEEGDVFGAPVVEAARLVGAAEAGQILATSVVRMLAGSRSTAGFADLGFMELKGLPEPVAVCEVAWEPAPVSTVPLPALVADVGRVFVGRDGELERLAQLWKEAAAGERRVALVAGEPGIGKTRLASVAARGCYEEGAVVLAGRCDEDLGVPYQPFVEALRRYVTHATEPRLGRHARELVRLIPEVAEIVPGLPPPLRSDPETERYRLFDAVAAWLTDVSGETPVLLVLDDLQWAAKPTLLLLRHVLRSAEAMSLLVVATYRDSDVGRGDPLTEFLADLRREAGVERLALTGLDAAGVADYLVQAAGHDLDDAGEELARAVWRETEGSPFFVAEVMRHLVESGAVEQRDGRWVVTAALDELGIPEGVRDVVGRRLSRLSENANRVLACSSVAGLEFEPAVVQTAGGFEEDTVLSALEEAVAARLLVEVPGPVPRNRFAHALVRATLYDELTAAHRVALHRKVAEAIETLHAQALDDYLPALAHHWARASAPAADAARAVDYATRAGNRALVQLAHDEAAAWYGQALELLDAVGVTRADPRRVELLISRGQAELRAGDREYRQTLLEAATLAKRAGDTGALARAAVANHRGLHSSSRGMDAERVAVVEESLRVLPSTDSVVRAQLLAVLASELWSSPEHERRYRLADEALAMARRLGNPSTLARVLVTRMAALVMTADRAREMAEFATLAHQIADPALVFWAKSLGGMTKLNVGDAFGFTLDVEEAGRLAEELGQPTMQWLATMLQATAHRVSGRLDAAEVAARRALEIGDTAGLPDASHIYENNLFWVRYDQGRLPQLLEACEHYASGSSPPTQSVANLGLAYAELGRLSEASALLDRLATDDFAIVTGGMFRMVELTVTAEICAAVDDHPRARALHGLLAPHRGLIANRGSAATGAVDHQLALLSAVLGRFDEADTTFRSAAQLHERLAAPTWLARTRLEWARLLLTRRAVGDAERARRLLGQAVATAGELGLGTVERRSLALLEQT